MPMLTGTLELHDIDNVERFCADIAHKRHEKIRAAFAQAGRNYGTHAQEDFLAYLIDACWQLSLTYRPGGIRFSTYAGHHLRHHVVENFLRTELGRTVWKFKTHTYERPRPIIESLDARPDDPDPETHRDPPRDRDTSDLVRLLRTRSSDEAWRDDTRRTPLPHRAA